MIKAENVNYIYQQGMPFERQALYDVNIEIEDGSLVALIGHTGSGKSTLLHLLGGVDRPTSGKIYIDGNEINNMNNDKLAIFRRRQIGIVYQFYNLIPILTVEENISLPCDLDGNRPDKERMDLILKSFGLFERRNHLPNELSGGQQQRTSIARALINNPAILLADEPTGNLDSKSTEEIMSILKMSNRDFNQTIIMITHNLEIAKEADRIITIQDGKILREA